ASCKGLIRDVSSRWICGFSKKVGNAIAYVVELWGVYKNFKLAHSKDMLVVELQLLSRARECKKKYVRLELGIKESKFYQNELCVKVLHIYMKGNSCVDVLANLVYDIEINSLIYKIPHTLLSQLLIYDVIGTYTLRLINV
ncbi:putative ribonuclease H protein, partial [Mucuna pruriens]